MALVALFLASFLGVELVTSADSAHGRFMVARNTQKSLQNWINMKKIELLFKSSTMQGKKVLPNGQNWPSYFFSSLEGHSKELKLPAYF